MKSIITEKREKMSQKEFMAAMSAMRYFIGIVDKRIRLPHPDSQYVEWQVHEYREYEYQWYAVGKPKYLHDTRFASRDERTRNIRMPGSSNWLTAPMPGKEIVMVATNQIHTICRAKIAYLDYIFLDERIEILTGEIAGQISHFARKL